MNLKELITWSEKEFIDLPWRKNRSLYRTLVSEIMLQQTTVGTVKNHYERFLKTFPDLKSLASASNEDLLVAWKGLGYYRRARNLKKIAEVITFDNKGKFPEDREDLQLIPGIGPYTASAIMAIGMDRPALAVDANLERVIARLYGIKEEKGLKLQRKIQVLFATGKILSENVSPRALNEALMDLGRTYCQARKASCELCHLKRDCLAFKNKKPLEYPIEKIQSAFEKPHELHLLRVYVVKNKKLLVYKKSEKEWLSGQYEVPTFIVKSTDPKLKQYPQLLSEFKEEAISFKTWITKYKIKNSVIKHSEIQFKKMKFTQDVTWVNLSDEKANFSTATMKGLKLLL